MDTHSSSINIDYAKCPPCSGLICIGVCPVGIIEQGDKQKPIIIDVNPSTVTIAGDKGITITGQNFGSWTDMMLTGSLNHGNWVPFNAIPTSAHTIWGVLVGMLLLKDWSPRKKILTLMGIGSVGVIVGFAMSPFIPIIKHICTSSFIIVSGGWCLIGMGISYWLIDVLKFKKVPMFFAVFGMNPLFIYLMASSFRNFFGRLTNPFVYRIFGWTSEVALTVLSTLIIAAMLWYVCYFLYKNRIFIRL